MKQRVINLLVSIIFDFSIGFLLFVILVLTFIGACSVSGYSKETDLLKGAKSEIIYVKLKAPHKVPIEISEIYPFGTLSKEPKYYIPEELTRTEILEETIPEKAIEYLPMVEEICDDYYFVKDLDLIILSIMKTETNFTPNLSSSDGTGCIGLMQVNQSIHQDRAAKLGVENLWDPYGNILVATDLLEDLYYNYANESIELAVMMYNMNFKTARQLYSEGKLSNYAEKVFEYTGQLQEDLYG